MCDCGYHPSIATDKSHGFEPVSTVCPVCAGKAKWERHLLEQDKAIPHDAAAMLSRPSDGRRTGMNLMTPDAAKMAAEARENRVGPSRAGQQPRG